MITIGLDISTSFTGVCILNDDALEKYYAIELKKYEDVFDKADIVRDNLANLRLDYKKEDVCIFIEQSLSAFRPGMSSAQVIQTLTRFNGIVSWLCFDVFHVKPQFIGATTARKALGIKIPKGADTKKTIIEHIQRLDTDFKVAYTAYGNPKPGTADAADAIVIARAGRMQCLSQKS